MLRPNDFRVRTPGTGTVDGIDRRFKSMRPQRFPLSATDWPPEPDARTKSTGLSKFERGTGPAENLDKTKRAETARRRHLFEQIADHGDMQ